MKRILIALTVVMLSTMVLALQQGNHNGNALSASIEYQGFTSYVDYSHLGLGNLPVYYIGGYMYYEVSVTNEKKSRYNHLVLLVTHRDYLSGNLVPGYQADPFSGLPYHNIVYIDSFRTEASFDLSFLVPWGTIPGAGQTDLLVYRGYDRNNQSQENQWSTGRIVFEGTLGYFCPPEAS